MGHPAKGGERLPLAAGRDHDHLLVGEVLDLLRRDEEAVRRAGHAQVGGDVEVLPHRAPDEGDAAVEPCGGVDRLLDPVDVGGEAGHDDAARAAREDLEQGRADARLRRGDAGAVGVGRVAAEAEQALAPELGEPRDVRGNSVDRRLVELVVAGDEHRAELRGQGDGPRVGDRVRHVHELDLERAGLHPLSGGQLAKRHVAELVLVELGADHADREQAAVDHGRHTDLAEHVRESPDVVLVAVREHDRLDVVRSVAQAREVRQDEVDAEHVRGREHQAGVDHHDPTLRLDDGHVLADLPQPAEREDPNAGAGQS